MKNPFFYDETESYSLEDIYDMFVGNDSDLGKLYMPRHNFICGDRGTGKSMLLRYLEPFCQFKLHNGWSNFFNKPNSFLAFYFVFPKGVINLEAFKKDIPAIEQIYEHYINMLLFKSIIHTIEIQLSEIPTNSNIYKRFVDSIIEMLYPIQENVTEIDALYKKTDEPYKWLNCFIDKEISRCIRFCSYYGIRKEEYTGSLTDYHSFILPLAKLIKNLFNFKNHIYFLIDDAATSSILKHQMKVFNTWISNRNHVDLSIKISAVPTNYTTFLTKDGSLIDNRNDFQYIHLDNYGSKNEEALKKEITEILKKRISQTNMQIDELFADDIKQNSAILSARKALEEKVKTIEVKDKRRYVYRYTMQQFYKNKNTNKRDNDRTSISRSYAGVDDIIAFSSYNIRECLKICSKVFEEAYSDDFTQALVPIPVELQNKVINEISKNEVVGIELFKQQHSNKNLLMLKNMIDSLGNLYRQRLLDFENKEYGVTAFQVEMATLDSKYVEIIKIAVENSYLLRRFYSDRNGKSMNIAYALNKMFFPYYKLELNPFAGRIKIPNETFELCFTDTKAFLKKMTKTHPTSGNIQLTFDDYLIETEQEDNIEDYKNDLSELFR